MKKKILTGVLSVLLYFTVAFGMVSVTYAWLCNGKTVDLNVKGTAIANYFYSGSGTANDPYILTTPRHVYNLAWLQYLGMFNETNSSGALASQTYFKLNNDIDMADGAGEGYQTIPPIGTSEYPFLGNFNGNGKTISNAIVANQIGQDGLLAHPPVVEDVLYSEIIGFFGIVGDYTGAVTLTDDQLRALEVKNLNLESVTIKTSTQKSLAGLFAGYVNGNISNINVVSGSITAKQNVLPYTETLNGGTDSQVVINDTLAMSKYALIGDYHTTKINWVGGPGSVSTNTGQNTGFGGSIDMLSLAKRVQYMLAAGNTKVSGYYYGPDSTVNSTYHLYGQTNSNKLFTTTDTAAIFYFAKNTYLPLNIDVSLLNETHYKSKLAESVLETNTGYIVGSSSSSSAYPRIAGKQLGRICHSIQGNQTNWSTITYDNAKNANGVLPLQILTIKADETGNPHYYVIKDSYNALTSGGTSTFYSGVTIQDSTWLNLTQYDDEVNNVRSKLEALLKDGGNVIQGLQFKTAAPTVSTVLNQSVTLGGEQVTGLVEGTIHFKVANRGVITMVAGTYLGGASASLTTSNQGLPALYRVIRDDDTDSDIDRLDVINKIYESAGHYYYNDESKPADAKLVYSSEWTLNLRTDSKFLHSLFYFEIPVEAGEFVIGGSGKQSAYIMYLDIGANAGEDVEEVPGGGDGNTGVKPEDAAGTITGIAFAYKNGNSYVQIVTMHTVNNETVAVAVTYVFTLKNTAATTHSGATAGFTATNASTVTVTNSNTGQFSVTENPATSDSG